MDEDIEVAAITYQQNKQSIEAEVISENINSPEDLDTESSANTEVNKDKDAVATVDY